MKQTLLIALIIMTSITANAQKEVKAINHTITAFAQAGDNNDAEALAQHLDANFRIVMNQLFGSKEVAVMPREVYLEKIKNKEFGGDTRQLTIENVVVNGLNASAMVTYKGSKMTFVALTTLVKDAGGTWKLVSEVPTVKP